MSAVRIDKLEKIYRQSRIQKRPVKLTTSVDVNSGLTGKKCHALLGLCLEVVTGTMACWTGPLLTLS